MILGLFRKDIGFDNIQGYYDIKNIVNRALSSEENYNLLLCGPPASAKSLFLHGILECRNGVYFDGSNTTNRILDVLEEDRPKIICIDELDKMPRQFQNQLLNFMESGRVKIDQQRKQYDFDIKGAKVFATCNEINRLSKYYDKVLTLDPTDVHALTDKGVALRDLRNYTDAIKYFDKALSIDPKHVTALDDKGLALDHLGNQSGAIEYFDKARVVKSRLQMLM
jgi:tetratricopeptide (TPR) repeat protein